MKKNYLFGLAVILALFVGCQQGNKVVKPITKSEMVVTATAVRDDGSSVEVTPKDLKVFVKDLPTGFTVIETQPFKIGKMPFTMTIKYTVAPKDLSRKSGGFVFNNFEGSATVLNSSNPIFMTGAVNGTEADLKWNFDYGKNKYIITLKK